MIHIKATHSIERHQRNGLTFSYMCEHNLSITVKWNGKQKKTFSPLEQRQENHGQWSYLYCQRKHTSQQQQSNSITVLQNCTKVVLLKLHCFCFTLKAPLVLKHFIFANRSHGRVISIWLSHTYSDCSPPRRKENSTNTKNESQLKECMSKLKACF